MSTDRFELVRESFRKKAPAVEIPSRKASEYFGEQVFDRAQMRKYLDSDTLQALLECIDKGHPLDQQEPDASSFPNDGGLSLPCVVFLRNYSLRNFSQWLNDAFDPKLEEGIVVDVLSVLNQDSGADQPFQGTVNGTGGNLRIFHRQGGACSQF